MSGRERSALWVGLAALFVAGAAALLMGAPLSAFGPGERLRLLTEVRLPEALTALAVGGSLGLAGLLLQLALQNDLADPYVMGVAGGSTFGAVAALLLLGGVSPALALPVRALSAFGAGLAALEVLRRAARGRVVVLLLGGVVVNTAFAAGARALAGALSPGQLAQVNAFLTGYIPTPPMVEPLALAVPALAAALYASFRGRRLDLLLLPDDEASALGGDPARGRRRALLAGTLLSAGAVTLAGMIGFVGFLAPHAARALAGHRHRVLAPLSFLLGAAALLAAHALAKGLAPLLLLPVGAYTSLIGAPLFVVLMVRAGREARL